jgi:hypothetical protein
MNHEPIEPPTLLIIHTHSALHEGNLLPAKLNIAKQVCSVSFRGKEIFKDDFEYLTGTCFAWVPASNGQVPAEAITSGTSTSHEPLYIGRARLAGSVTPGRIDRRNGCIYFPYRGAEQSAKSYDVLVKSFNGGDEAKFCKPS